MARAPRAEFNAIEALMQAKRLLDLHVSTNRAGVKKLFMDQLIDGCEGRAVIAEGDRAEQLAAIDLELRHLQRAEEQMIRATEEMGAPVLRREDAPPAVVLADDKELAA